MVPSYEPEKTHLDSESTRRALRGHAEGTQMALEMTHLKRALGTQHAMREALLEMTHLERASGTQHAMREALIEMTHLERASVASPRTAPRWRDTDFTAARRCPDCKLNFSSAPSSPPK